MPDLLSFSLQRKLFMKYQQPPQERYFFCSVADFQYSVAGGYFFRYMLLFSMQAHYSPETQHEQFSFILHPYRTSFTLAHGDYFYW